MPPRLTKSARWAKLNAYRILGSHRRFDFEGQSLKYFYHPYNNTADNERAIELSIAEQFLRPNQNVLEIGNVLNHYRAFPHDVIDKYEVSPGVINCDVTEFTTSTRYDLIVSISTIEHVGWDESTREREKPIRAIERLKTLMAPGATMLITIPGSYNPFLDEFLESGSCTCRLHHRYQRISWLNRWQEVSKFSSGVGYGKPYPCANSLHVLIF
jgi:hypothetical protein